MISSEQLNQIFDKQLYQVSMGLSHEQLDNGGMFLQLEKIKEWKSRFGYTLNIYGNDHYINGQPHFHLDNKEKGIAAKLNFEGEVLESKGKNQIDSKLIKEIKFFLKKNYNKLVSLWNQKNPNLAI